MAALFLTLLASGYLFAQLFIIGKRTPSYRHTRHTISELGEFGSPEQRLVALGVFLPVGLLLLLVWYLLGSTGQPAALLALCVAVGYLVAAAFPCDPGSPLGGSPRQALHNLGGAVEYIGGGLALLRLSEALGQPFRVVGFVVLGGAMALSIPGIAAVARPHPARSRALPLGRPGAGHLARPRGGLTARCIRRDPRAYISRRDGLSCVGRAAERDFQERRYKTA